MAEKKIGDIAVGLIFLVFFVGAFSAILMSFDNQFIGSNVGSQLEGTANITDSDYKSFEKDVYDDTYNTSSFSITTGSDVDVRGTSQATTISKNNPSTIIKFINSVSGFLIMNKWIMFLISSLVIITGTILLLRFLRPGGA